MNTFLARIVGIMGVVFMMQGLSGATECLTYRWEENGSTPLCVFDSMRECSGVCEVSLDADGCTTSFCQSIVCQPDCSCAADTFVGQTCQDQVCGTTCEGTRDESPVSGSGCGECPSGTTFCHDGPAPCYVCLADSVYRSLSIGAACSYSCECQSGSCNCDNLGTRNGSGFCCGVPSGSSGGPSDPETCAFTNSYGAAGR